MSAKRHAATLTEEGGGVVVTCSCDWLRWEPTRKQALDAHAEHKPKPRKPPREHGP